MSWLVKPVVCVIAAAFLSEYVAREIAAQLASSVFVIVQILLTASFYFVFLIITGSVTREDFSRARSIFV